ncbi:MAG TPA: phosphoglycolate phosphatase [Gammaproteobacteria bacterium]|nr:phosphoglycolate phosphatase [Gammaproteobacteria bacterium]
MTDTLINTTSLQNQNTSFRLRRNDEGGELISLILFDLDGTLADTAPDIAVAINTLRMEEQRDPLPYAQLRALVSRGANALLYFAFGTRPGDADHDRLRQRFLTLYGQNLCQDTQLFPDVEDVLQTLETAGYTWGIVTNKPGALARPLLDKLQLRKRLSCLVTGDCLPHRKPHPDPLLDACQQANRSVAQAVYVGDAQCDMQAAQAANMPGLLAAYGYISEDDNPNDWQPTATLKQPADLLDWLHQQHARKAV